MPESVSVVITTKDRQELGQRALRSVLAQSMPVNDIVIVDDGSTSPFVSGSSDPRIRLIHLESSRGPCVARNVGLREARGSWVAFLDDDDEFLPHMVEASLRIASRTRMPPPVAVLTGMEVVDGAGAVLGVRRPPTSPRGRDFFLEGGRGDIRATNTLFAPREVLTAIGGWDESIRACEHDDLLLRLNAAASIHGGATVTYRMRAHGGSRLHEDLLACAQGMKRTIAKHRAAFLRHRRRYAHYLGAMGVLYLKAGCWGQALLAATRAVVRDPTRPRYVLWLLAALMGPRSLALYRRTRSRLAAAAS